jgi:serine/threonine protein phosphatase PrpC
MNEIPLDTATFVESRDGKRVSEDSALALAGESISGVIAVADGIGGRPNGAQASAIAIRKLEEQWSAKQSVDESLFSQIVDAIKASEGSPSAKGMGTTLSVGMLTPSSFRVLHVGDCVIYHLRNLGIVRLTRPQTEFEEFVSQGVFERSFEPKYPRRNVLVSALTAESQFNVYKKDTDWKKGDRFIAASDGVERVLSPTDIRDISVKSETASMLADGIRNAIRQRGPRDDFSAAILCL